jgi:hypothetical protein
MIMKTKINTTTYTNNKNMANDVNDVMVQKIMYYVYGEKYENDTIINVIRQLQSSQQFNNTQRKHNAYQCIYHQYVSDIVNDVHSRQMTINYDKLMNMINNTKYIYKIFMNEKYNKYATEIKLNRFIRKNAHDNLFYYDMIHVTINTKDNIYMKYREISFIVPLIDYKNYDECDRVINYLVKSIILRSYELDNRILTTIKCFDYKYEIIFNELHKILPMTKYYCYNCKKKTSNIVMNKCFQCIDMNMNVKNNVCDNIQNIVHMIHSMDLSEQNYSIDNNYMMNKIIECFGVIMNDIEDDYDRTMLSIKICIFVNMIFYINVKEFMNKHILIYAHIIGLMYVIHIMMISNTQKKLKIDVLDYVDIVIRIYDDKNKVYICSNYTKYFDNDMTKNNVMYLTTSQSTFFYNGLDNIINHYIKKLYCIHENKFTQSKPNTQKTLKTYDLSFDDSIIYQNIHEYDDYNMFSLLSIMNIINKYFSVNVSKCESCNDIIRINIYSYCAKCIMIDNANKMCAIISHINLFYDTIEKYISTLSHKLIERLQYYCSSVRMLKKKDNLIHKYALSRLVYHDKLIGYVIQRYYEIKNIVTKKSKIYIKYQKIRPILKYNDLISVFFINDNTEYKYDIKIIREYMMNKSMRYFDFCICDNKSDHMFILEIDDISHRSSHVKLIDNAKNNICKINNIKIHRIILHDAKNENASYMKNIIRHIYDLIEKELLDQMCN